MTVLHRFQTTPKEG
jgi:hypothetical protein